MPIPIRQRRPAVTARIHVPVFDLETGMLSTTKTVEPGEEVDLSDGEWAALGGEAKAEPA